MKQKVLVLLLGLAASLATGCTLAPRYVRPEPPVPDTWTVPPAGGDSLAAANVPSPAVLKLQEFFPDANFQEVVKTALANNRDLRLAALNVERARELYHVKRNEILPSAYALGDGSKQHTPAAASNTGSAVTSEQYGVDFGVSGWEIDFFGRIRSLKNVALEQYRATTEARRAAQLMLVSQVARTYLTLAADRENMKLAESTVESQQASVDMVRRRYEVGLGSELDLRRAQTQVELARDAASRYKQAAELDRNALDFLAGTRVPAALLPDNWESVTPPREISAGLSSEVLLSRPDVMAAEHQLEAANANIGAARAAFFPRISLTALVGTASDAFSGLFAANSDSWVRAGQAAMPIFDARTIAAAKASKADRAMAVTQYEKTIQAAFREVSDALAVQVNVDDQLSARQSLLEATSEAYRLASERYELGLENYLGVLDAQRSLLAVQQGLIATRLGKYANLVNLYTILGAGDD
jgi:multidrug efflux system outer membrane protein